MKCSFKSKLSLNLDNLNLDTAHLKWVETKGAAREDYR